ncbi:DUF3987 domain-containing protein [Qipengyuania gaetbuli]|uniref:DUF3987 domain-containing protein n=1 Tax=Qipengyuania gaetbuli TaxID=266952 RepID=UPI001CFCFD08|nr:DUF3987 domain-containing protein [Qipengyuania gaetbuli]
MTSAYEPESGATITTLADLKEREARVAGVGSPTPLFASVPKGKEYPADALGPIMGPAARAIAASVQCPLAMAANAVLSAASLAAQLRANIEIPILGGKANPLSLFLLTVAASGERKSTADAASLAAVDTLSEKLAEEAAPEKLRFENLTAARNAHVAHLKRNHSDNEAELARQLEALGPAPQPPLFARLVSKTDPTWEGIYNILKIGYPTHGIMADDAATFLGGYAMRAENKSATTSNLCRIWDGGSIDRIRGGSGDGAEVLLNRRMAMHLMVQSKVATEFIVDPVFREQGLLARFLITQPESLVGSRFHNDAYRDAVRQGQDAINKFHAAIYQTLSGPVDWRDPQNRNMGPNFRLLRLTPDAVAAFEMQTNAIEERMREGGDCDDIRPFAGRLTQQAIRIAGIMTIIENPQAEEVDEETLLSAMVLCDFYLSETKRLYNLAEIEAELKQADALLKRLQQHARERREVALPEIYQKKYAGLKNATDARRVVGVLEKHGWLVPIKGGVEVEGTHYNEAWSIRDDV